MSNNLIIGYFTRSRRTAKLNRTFSTCLIFLLLLLTICTPTFAAPQGGTVVGGAAQITQPDSLTTQISQVTDKAIINWNGFSIDVNELVKFIQPGADSVALNRVTGGDPSVILGQMLANGRVFLVNPNGVVFAPGAKVDVGSLLATTFDINNDNFMSGKYDFSQLAGKDSSYVINKGEIKVADNGFVFLVAPSVKNDGLVIANVGKVVLGAGQQFYVDFRGDKLVSYAVSGTVAEKVKGPDGAPLSSAVSNTGTISANGGEVLLTGDAAREIVSSVINQDGIIEAKSLVSSGGSVKLIGRGDGIVQNTGKIDVSAIEAGAKSGTVSITGEYAGNFGSVLALGAKDSNGGNVTLNSTNQTMVSTTGVIDASGVDNSNGGNIKLLSDGNTTDNGTLRARGGDNGGDGGFAELSSQGGLSFTGTVDTIAAAGKTGMLLIDPKNVIIAAAGGAALTAVDQFTDTPAADATIAAATINGAGSNVTIQANNDITVNSNINIGTGGVGLALQGGRSVIINNNITTNNGVVSITANDQTATLANRDAGAGSITMASGATIDAGSANINMTIGTLSTAGGITVGSVKTTGNVTMNSADAITGINQNSGADPNISATILNMNVTKSGVGLGPMIGADGNPLEIKATTLNSTTNDGSMNVADLLGGLEIGTINAGAGTVAIDAKDGAITAGVVGGNNITAGAVNLTTSTSIVYPNPILIGGAIGTSGSPLKTNVGVLAANTVNGGVYINEADGVLINSIIAKQQAITPVYDSNAGKVLLGPGGSVGTYDVSVIAQGDIVLDTVTAPNAVTIQSVTGTIFDNNQLSNNVTARTLSYSAAGAIGQSADQLENQVETVNAAATNGGVFLTEGFGGAVTSIMAGGTGNNVTLNGSIKPLSIGTITAAGGTVTIQSDGGAVLDGNGASNNISSDNLSITATGGIGTGSDGIDTTVNSQITTSVTDAAAVTNIDQTGALTAVSAKTKNGNVNIDFTGGSVGFTGGTSYLLNASGGIPMTFENTGGSLALGTIYTYPGSLTLTALGSITDDVNDAVRDIAAGTLILKAGTSIGAAGNEIDTNVSSLDATAGNGGIFIRESGYLTLTAKASGAGSDIDVATLTGGLILGSVSAPDQVILGAGGTGSITAGSPSQVSITGNSATLTAGGDIGVSGTPLNTSLTTLSATAQDNLFVSNRGALIVTTGTATTGNMGITAGGDLTIGALTAVGHTITLNSTGIIKDNGSPINITATTANLSGKQIGEAIKPIHTTVGTLVASATSGGIYIRDLGTGVLNLTTATAQGVGSDIDIEGAGDINLGAVTSRGNTVTLKAAGQISDSNGPAVNVTSAKLIIDAGGGIAPIQTAVDQLSASGGTGGVAVANANPLALTSDSLTSGSGNYSAVSITILDNSGGTISLAPGTSLILQTSTGNIVMLNQEDTIEVSGGASITITAGNPGSGAVAILGNLTSNGGDITITSDSHMTIGLLDAGNGDVTLTSRHGIILDGNGATTNIIGDVVTLSGTTPTPRDEELHTTTSIANASAAVAETNTKETLSQITDSTAAAYAAATDAKQTSLDITNSDVDNKQSIADSTQATADTSAAVDLALGAVSTGLHIAADVSSIVAGAMQAVPFTGDGGSATVSAVLLVAADVADIAKFAEDIVSANDATAAGNAAADLAAAQAQQAAITEDLGTLQALSANAAENASVAKAAYDAAVIARDHAAAVSDQAILAEDTSNVIGSNNHPMGIQAGTLNIAVTEKTAPVSQPVTPQNNIYVNGPAAIGLGNISVTGDTSSIYVSAPGDLTVKGTIVSHNLTSLNSSGGSILDGGGSITSPDLQAVAATGIGNNAPIQTDVDRVAMNGGSGVVNFNNAGPVEFTTLGSTTGLSGAGNITITSPTINIKGTDITQTGSGNVLLTGSVVLTNNASLVTSSGNINVVGTINSDPSTPYSLTLNAAGGGDVTVTNTIGGTSPFSTLLVYGNDVNLFNIGGAAAGVNGLSTVTASNPGSITFTGTTYNANQQTYNAGSGTNAITLAGGATTFTSTDDAISYTGAVHLNSNDMTVRTGSGNITYNNTITGPGNLLVSTTGTGTFLGAISGLTSLMTNTSGTIHINSGTISTVGNQEFNDNVILDSATTLISTGSGDIIFNRTLDGGQTLALNTAGNNIFNDIVGGSAPLASLTTDLAGGTTINTIGITTSGNQTYNDPVLLTSDTALASNGIGNITFNNTLNGKQNLALNTAGTNTFNALVGGIAGKELASITTNAGGGTTIHTTNVNTFGDQTYNDAVLLTSDTALASIKDDGTENNGNITFNNTLDGKQNLALNTSGTNTFSGVVGGIAGKELASITTDLAGGTTIHTTNVNTFGNQTYNDAVLLTSDTALASIKDDGTENNGNITFNNTLDGRQNLALNTSGTNTFNAVVGGIAGKELASITTDAAGGTTIHTTNVNTFGDQTYNDAVLLTSDTALASIDDVGAESNGNITFNNTLNGKQNLALNTAGTNTFNAVVGGIAGKELASITTDAAGGTTIHTTNVNAFGDQTYNDAVLLTSDTALASIKDNGTENNGNITFNNTLDGRQNLALNTAGTNTFNGVVGGITGKELASITTDLAGGTTINTTNVNTFGAQTYNDPVLLTSDTALASIKDDGTENNGNITFNNTLDGKQNLTLNTAGTNTFNAVVGGIAGKELASITTDIAGGTTIHTTNINTIGDQTYNDPVLLTSDTALASIDDVGAESNGNITFNNTLDGKQNLALNTAGTNTFNAVVGGIAGKELASITTDLAGGTTINTTNVNSFGNQTYNDAVLLTSDTALASIKDDGTENNGNITFNNTLDGEQNLALNTAGTNTFNAVVGGIAGEELASITTDLAGGTTINTTNVNTIGDQTYNDPVLLTSDTALASIDDVGAESDGNITFNNTLNGKQNLALNTAGTNTFNAVVGGLAGKELASITTSEAGGMTIHTTNVNTFGDQTYNDAVLLTSDTALASIKDNGTENNGNITFNNTLDGRQNLALNTAGTNTFNAVVGGIAGKELASITTDIAGGTTINTTNVNTFGAQTYNDPVLLTSDTALASIKDDGTENNGNITFNNTLDGEQNLTLNTAGTNTFNAVVGGIAGKELASITTDIAGGTTIHTTNINTIGDQTYNDPVLLTSDTALASIDDVGAESNGNITFNNTLDGKQNLALNTAGINTFNAVVGGIAGKELASITTDLAGGTTINTTNVNTFGNQTYNDAVLLTSDTALASIKDDGTENNGNITFNNTLDGKQNLTLNTAGTNTFNAVVGGIAGEELASITTDIAGGTTINTTNVNTIGDQIYNDPVLLTSDTALASIDDDGAESDGNITFNNTLDGKQNLALNTAGTNTFNAVVGGIAGKELASITTSEAGGTTIHTTNVNTFGDQTYNDAVLLTSDTALASIKDNGTENNGNITFNNTLDGRQNLALNTAGTNTFNAVVGGIAGKELASITTDIAGGTTINTTNVNTFGAQTYNDPVLLTSDTELASIKDDGTENNGNITFNNTLDGEQNLTLNTAGTNTFNAVVGGIAGKELASITTDVAGGMTINTTNVNTIGDQTYNDPVLLTSDTALAGIDDVGAESNGNITFNNTLDGEQNLALNTAGTNTFNAVVGGIAGEELASITTDVAGGTTVNTTNVNTFGDQTYNDAVLLTSDTALASIDDVGAENNGNITFNNTLDGAQNLALNTAGTNTFNKQYNDGIVGGIEELASITTDAAGDTVINTTRINTTGDQTYNDPVTLTSDTALSASDSGDITFNNTLDGNMNIALNTAGNNVFNDLVGDADPLASITTDAPGGTTINTAGITTTGDQTYNDPVTLTSDTALSSVDSGDITFNGTLDGNMNLALNTAGNNVFNNVVGGGDDLMTITTDADGGTTINTTGITTTGDQTYNDPVTLTSDTTLTSSDSGDITFNNTLDGEQNLILNTAGNNVFNDPVGGHEALATITTDADGGTTINTTEVNTTGDQTYNDPVTLTSDTTLASSNTGDITFNNTLDGAQNLILNTAGNNVFNDVVGGDSELTTITTNAPGGTIINTTAITTTGNQTYNDPTTLTSNTTLASSSAGNITFNGILNGAKTLLLNTAGNSVFNNVVGGTTALTSITTDAAGGTTINTTAITTSGNQTYNDPTTLTSNTTLASNSSGNITFNGTLNGAKTLLLNTAGNNVFNNVVGGTAALTSITTDAPGGTTINTTAITTTGNQTYNDPTTLTSNTTLASNSSGNITFNGTLNGAKNLTLNTAGNNVFNNVVGGTAALTSITTDAPGGTTINTTAITTTGNQTYNDPTTLTSNTTLASNSSGNITFNGTLNGAKTLLLNTAGNNVFNNVVGGTVALTSITTDAPGGTTINTTAITTTGNQTYNDPTTLTSNTTLASSGSGNITFNGTLNGAKTLTLNTAGNNVFNNIVGGTAALSSITTDAPGGTTINTTAITTTGNQTYNDPTTLTSNTTLASSGSGNITFNGTLNGAKILTLNTAGNSVFNNIVGGTTALTSITTDAPGGTTINTTAITTSGAQTYNNSTTLTSNTTLASSGSGNITFNGTLNGAKALALNTAGNNVFNNVVGGSVALASITTDTPGATIINTTAISTSGEQTYNDPVTLASNTTLSSTNAGNITFNGTLNGAKALTLNTAGSRIFNGIVGGDTALQSITSTSGGSTHINSDNVTTSGSQTYTSDLVLIADTSFASSNGSISFGGAIDGPFGLTVTTPLSATFNGVIGGITPLTTVDVHANSDVFMQVNVTDYVSVDTTSANGDITLVSTTRDLPVGLLNAGEGGVSLNSFAAITDANDTAGVAMNVISPNIDMTAKSGIGTIANPIEITGTNLAATTVNGGIYINNTGSLNITGVNGVSGLDVTTPTSQGDIVINTTNDLVVDNSITNTGGGDISLTSGNDVTLNNGTAANGGDITIEAPNSVLQNSDISNTLNGNVTVVAESGDVTMAPDTNTTVGQGNVAVTAQNDITVNEIITAAGGSGGNVALTVGTGSILDGNGSAPNVTANNLEADAPSGGVAEQHNNLFNNDFLHAYATEVNSPGLFIFNNHITGGTNIDQYYMAVTSANPQTMMGGNNNYYNSNFDNLSQWMSRQPMQVPGMNMDSPLPSLAGFSLTY